jgi:hypothetical protein
MFENSGKRKISSALVVIACLLVAGPELGFGLELIALVDLFGIELILFCFAAPLWFYYFEFQSWLYKFDPYYFVPSTRQALSTPGILAHAIPGYMPLLFWVVSLSVIAS